MRQLYNHTTCTFSHNIESSNNYRPTYNCSFPNSEPEHRSQVRLRDSGGTLGDHRVQGPLQDGQGAVQIPEPIQRKQTAR